MNQRTVLIAGATGMVGSHCLAYLLESETYAQVHVLTRRPLAEERAKLVEHVVDFDSLSDYAAFPAVSDVFCCLGAPLDRIHKRDLFFRVDFTYPLRIAELARARGAAHLALVTSGGIGESSPLYYCRIKARLEREILDLGFESAHIFRPSLLLGQRRDRHPLQKLFGALLRPLGPLFVGRLGQYRPVAAQAVGFAMASMAQNREPGARVVASHEIHRYYRRQNRDSRV